LITGDARNERRKWTSRDLALADLQEEGWLIDGPHQALDDILLMAINPTRHDEEE